LGVTGKYFLIRQADWLKDAPAVLGFAGGFARKGKLEKRANILYVKEAEQIDYADYIDRPLLLVSDRLKSIVSEYHSGCRYRAAVLTERRAQRQKVYWNIELPETPCLAEQTTYFQNGLADRIVIDAGRTDGRSLFQITICLRTIRVVRLDLAESILRRGFYGFELVEFESD
jgi:hypothetical protein